MLHCSCDDDAVEITDAGRDVEAVAQHHLDIVALDLLEPRPGAVGQGPVAFDRQDVTGQPRQDGRLVAGAGADFEHAVMLLQIQLLGHVGHDKGLADGLPAGDAERAVTVGIATIGGLDEDFARDFFHDAQHRLVADPPPPQVELEHHLFRRMWRGRHGDLAGRGRDSDQDSDRFTLARPG